MNDAHAEQLISVAVFFVFQQCCVDTRAIPVSAALQLFLKRTACTIVKCSRRFARVFSNVQVAFKGYTEICFQFDSKLSESLIYLTALCELS